MNDELSPKDSLAYKEVNSQEEEKMDFERQME